MVRVGLVGLAAMVAAVSPISPSPAQETDARATLVFAAGMPDVSDPDKGGRLPELAGYLGGARAGATPVVFLHGGHSLGPSLLGSEDRGAHVVELINRLKPDAMLLAQREFAYGTDNAVARVAEASFPVLSANVGLRDEGGDPIPGTMAATVVEAGDLAVGVVGLTAPETVEAYLIEDITLAPPAEVLTRAVEGLRAEGVDAVVLMLDFALDGLDEMRAALGIDIVLMTDSDRQAVIADADGVVVHQGGTEALAQLDLARTGKGGGVAVSGRMVRLAGQPADPDMARMVAEHLARLDEMMGARVGSLLAPLDLTRPAVRGGENAFGDFLAEALRTRLGADVALVNGGGIRTDRVYPAGIELTMGDIRKMLPFGNHPTVVEVTGAQLRAALENGFSEIGDLGGRFPHIANMTVRYDPTQPVGRRVVEVVVDGKPLRPDLHYTVATSDYLANGGDGYAMLAEGRTVVAPQQDLTLWRVVVDAVTRTGGLEARVDGRLEVVDAKALLAGGTASLDLSAEERAYLDGASTITIGMMDAWPPLSFVDATDRSSGVSKGLLDALNRRLGGRLVLVPAPFKTNYQAVLDGTLDAIFDITPRPDRMELFNFTSAYLSIPHVIIAGRDVPFIEREEDLRGRTVALEKGFGNVKRFAAEYPEVTVKEYANTAAALDAVARGEADAYVGNRAVATYIMEQELMHNLKVHGRARSKPVVLAIGTAKDNPVLASILEKALADVSDEERRGIMGQWVFAAPSAGVTETVPLSPEETRYVAANPTFSVAATPDWPPFEFKGDDGRYQGITADLMRLAAAKVGLTPRPVFDKWTTLLDGLRTGDIDMAAGLFRTPDREQFLTFGDPQVEVYDVIYAQEGEGAIVGPSDLAGRRVVVEKGYALEEVLRRDHPGVRLVVVDNTLDALGAVVAGRADAYVGNQVVANYLIKRHLIQGLRIVGFFAQDANPLYFATGADKAVLHGILAKGYAAITDAERGAVMDRWVGRQTAPTVDQPKVDLTPEERRWIDDHPVIRVHNETDFPPFNFFRNNRPEGYSVDFMNLLADKLGVRVDYVSGPTWSEFTTMLAGHRLDVMLNIVRTPEREAWALFTEPYLDNPPVVVARDGTAIKSLDDLAGRSVCTPADFFYEQVLKTHFPKIRVVTTTSQGACLSGVSTGRFDATIGGLAVQNYLTGELFLNNIEIVYQIDDERLFNRLHIAVRDDWPVLRNILQKAMDALTEPEKRALADKWIGSDADLAGAAAPGAGGLSLRALLAQLIGVVVGFVVVVALLLAIYRRFVAKAGVKAYDSKVVVVSGVGFVALFLAGVVVATWLVLDQLERGTRDRTAATLSAILNETHHALQVWIKAELKLTDALVSNDRLNEVAGALLATTNGVEALRDSPRQAEVEAFFTEHFGDRKAFSYAVLSPTGTVVAASDVEAIGKTSPIWDVYRDRLSFALLGQSTFVPPTGTGGTAGDGGVQEVHFLSAIHGEYGQPVGVLSIGYPMAEAYSNLIARGRVMQTGESYVFDRLARLLSPTRFADDLRATGLIGEGENGILKVRIRDPGANLTTDPDKILPADDRPRTLMADAATQGRNGLMVDGNGYNDYRGVPVFGAWLWDEELRLGLATEVDAEEAMGEFFQTRLIILSLVGGAVFVGLALTAVSVVLGRRATKELEGLVRERTAELFESEQKSKLLLTSIGEGVFGTDTEGRVTFINPAACEMLGFAAEEMLGHKVHGLIHYKHGDGSDYPVTECPMWRAYTDGVAARVDDEVLWRKDGGSFPVEYNATPMYRKGELVGSVISFLDISRRLEAQAKVVDREARLSAVMANVADGIITIDEKGRIDSVNKAVEQIFGYSNEELTGANITTLMPEKHAIRHQGYIDHYLKTGEAHVIGQGARELTAKRRDGEEFPLELSIGEAFVGDHRLFVGGVRDITERKRAQAALEDAYTVISQSIEYAARIQRAVLTGEEMLGATMADHFVLWEPRDVVGGDIYWCQFWGNGILIALADCTGHGVPGAFMTLIATGAIDRAVADVEPGEVGTLIQRMHQIVQITLGQHGARGDSDDGLELGACYLTPDMAKMTYAGARFSLFVDEAGEISEIKGTRKGIGYRAIDHDQTYEEFDLDIRPGMNFYMTSDGFLDQVGGEPRRMFGKKRFTALLADIHGLPFADQKAKLTKALQDYQGEETRRDDVSVIGFKL